MSELQGRFRSLRRRHEMRDLARRAARSPKVWLLGFLSILAIGVIVFALS